MNMSVMAGGALIDHLGSDPLKANLPIVAVTSSRNGSEVAGRVNALMHKPFLHSGPGGDSKWAARGARAESLERAFGRGA